MPDVHIQHSLGRPSPGVLSPSAHRYRSASRTGLRFLSRAPLGFVYPPCAPRASIPQALFHAWNARGVPLTEPFALSEAEALSDPLAPVPFIPQRSAILLGRSLTMGTQAVGLCSSDKAVLGMEVIKSQTKPLALLRLSPLRSSSPAMEPASRFLPLCSYLKPPPIRTVTQDSDIGFLLQGPSFGPFRDHATFLAFLTSVSPLRFGNIGPWIIFFSSPPSQHHYRLRKD